MEKNRINFHYYNNIDTRQQQQKTQQLLELLGSHTNGEVLCYLEKKLYQVDSSWNLRVGPKYF